MWLIKYRNSRVSDPLVPSTSWSGESVVQAWQPADDHGASAVLVSGLTMWALDAARAEQMWGYLRADSLGQHIGQFTGDVLPTVPSWAGCGTGGSRGMRTVSSPPPISRAAASRRVKVRCRQRGSSARTASRCSGPARRQGMDARPGSSRHVTGEGRAPCGCSASVPRAQPPWAVESVQLCRRAPGAGGCLAGDAAVAGRGDRAPVRRPVSGHDHRTSSRDGNVQCRPSSSSRSDGVKPSSPAAGHAVSSPNQMTPSTS
jgi:hypothetical protein